MHYSVSQLAGQFGLSRSTLLYYDSIGLLKPEKRPKGSYRVYTEAQRDRLEHICQLRQTGVSLKEIGAILSCGKSDLAERLHQRLDIINGEINRLRTQQQVIVDLLGNQGLLRHTKALSKELWVDMLEKAGLDEEGMRQWHSEFERSAPNAHQDFLESLGISTEEIAHIRTWSRETVN